MRETFGNQPKKKPEGMLREIVFPELAAMGVATGDGRLLEELGRGVRELPLTIYGQFVSGGGHDGAVIVGTLHEVTFEDGLASGRGWVLDDDNGRDAVKYVKTAALRGNSVDLAETKAQFEYDEEKDELLIRFTEWKIGATTLVGLPAFGNARAEMLEDEELVASWMQDESPLIVETQMLYALDAKFEDEVTADASVKPSWDLFHQPESREAQKIIVGEPDENGWVPVAGHLALWNSCHDGILGRCTTVPRPEDNYASFNKPGVLTDKGMVNTGPIFLAGGHQRPDTQHGDYEEAYGGIENAWADVRITAGALGPWLSGIVRPGVTEDKVFAARASRISGHWIGSRLKAIVSVNAEGFDVPGDGFSLDSDGHVAELVASFPVCAEEKEAAEPATSDDFADDSDVEQVQQLQHAGALAMLDIAIALEDD